MPKFNYRAITDDGTTTTGEIEAESVENAETLTLLREFGVDYAQGHFIGRPSSMLQ